jgi:putative ABC transport system permease protein
MGVLTSVCGSLLPALETYRVSPLHVLQSSRWITGQPVRLARWSGAAAFAAAVAVATLLLPGRSLLASLAGATAAILAGALLCPGALWMAGRLASPFLARVFGATGLLAARQLTRSISRTGLAGASLTVALSLALAVGITVASFRYTFTIWLDQTITADLYLSLPVERGGAELSPALLDTLRAQPYVADLAALQTRRVALGDRDVLVVAVDPAAFGRLNRVPLREGDRERALQDLGAGSAWISETLANALDLGVGASLRIPGQSGAVGFPVAAVVQNYSAPNGMVYLQRSVFGRLFGAVPVRQAALWLKPGASLDEASRAVSALAGAETVQIARNRDLRAGALRVFERTFAVTDLMTGLAAVIAFIAVISAAAALLEERRQLIGYLRAIGVSRRQLAGAMALEACLLALVCGVMSWAIGYGVSAILVHVVNRRAFGWTLQFLPGSGNYGQLLGLSLAAALLGTLLPIYRMWRSPILSAIREE